MPEGNEIHRWAERHAAAFAGKVVRADGPQGRFADVDVIDGRRLERVMAVGKHLGYDFGKDRILHVHLGLQGDFTEGSGPLPEVRGRAAAADVECGGGEEACCGGCEQAACVVLGGRWRGPYRRGQNCVG